MSSNIKIEPSIDTTERYNEVIIEIKAEPFDDSPEEPVDSDEVKTEFEDSQSDESRGAPTDNVVYIEVKPDIANFQNDESQMFPQLCEEEDIDFDIRSDKPLSKPIMAMTIVDPSEIKSTKKRTRKGNKVKSFSCDICQRKLKSKRNLNLHIQSSHIQSRQYYCNTCNKGFFQLSHLRQHKLIHTGEKPYKCDVCKKGFCRSSHLRQHRMIHTGEKPYKCEECKKGFTAASSLHRHKLTHT